MDQMRGSGERVAHWVSVGAECTAATIYLFPAAHPLPGLSAHGAAQSVPLTWEQP